MNIQLKHSIFTLAALLTFTTCNDESEPESGLLSAVPLTVRGELAASAVTTREATYAAYQSGTFSDDRIYVTKVVTKEGVQSADANYTNIPYTYENGEFVPSSSNKYYFDSTNSDEVTFVASSTQLSASSNLMDFADQQKSLPGGVYFATAQASIQSPELTLRFRQQLSKITLKFTSKITQCILSGFDYTAAYLTVNGWVANGTDDSIQCQLTQNEGGTTTAVAMMLPQSNSTEGALTLTIAADDIYYSMTLSDFLPLAGKHYIYNVDITNKMATITGRFTIADYTDGGSTDYVAQ